MAPKRSWSTGLLTTVIYSTTIFIMTVQILGSSEVCNIDEYNMPCNASNSTVCICPVDNSTANGTNSCTCEPVAMICNRSNVNPEEFNEEPDPEPTWGPGEGAHSCEHNPCPKTSGYAVACIQPNIGGKKYKGVCCRQLQNSTES